MEYLQYLVIGAGIIFFISLIWILNLTGNLDYFKSNNQVKSPYHCLTKIVEKSDRILQSTRQPRNPQYQQAITSFSNRQIQSSQVSTENKTRQLVPYT